MFLDGSKPWGYDDVDMSGGYTLLDPHSQGASQTGGTGSDGNISPIGSGSGEDAGEMDGDNVEGEREDQLKELPGEMVLMREENQRVWEALVIEEESGKDGGCYEDFMGCGWEGISGEW